MMARFISREKAQKTQKPMLWLCIVLASYAMHPASAQDSLQDLLSASSLPPYKWFASTDPKHQNQDYLLLKPGETRRIPLAAGTLRRLWSTAFKPDKIVLALQNGNRVELLRDGRAKFGQVYEKAFTLYPVANTPAYPAASTPAPVRTLKSGAALLVTNRDTEPNKFFYQVAVRSVTKGSDNDLVTSKTAQVTLQPAAEVELWRVEGDGNQNIGKIEDIAFTITPSDLETLNHLRLRATWDAGASRAVDVPLLALIGQFFDAHSTSGQSGLGSHFFDAHMTPGPSVLGSLTTNPSQPETKTLSIHWMMPYGPGAHLSILNGGTKKVSLKHEIFYALVDSGPTRFCAAYGSARTQKGKPIPMLHVNGQGAFVGLALGIAPAADSGRRTFAYLEGNEIITADGKKYEGTGTEDFFNSAWYFPADNKPFRQPYHGMTFKSEMPPRVSAYRLMIPDAVPFKESLDFDFEHGRLNNSNDLEYRWVAFWYQKPPVKFQVADALGSGTEAAPQGGASNGLPVKNSPLKTMIFVALGAVTFVVVIRVIARLVRGSSSH